MRQYSLTSTKFSGNIYFLYDDDGRIVNFHVDAIIDDAIYQWLCVKFPVKEDMLQPLVAGSKTATLLQIPVEITFDMFWNAYGKKINRKRTEPLWDRLTDADKAKCLAQVKHYKAYLKRTGFRAAVDPDRYIKDRYYDTIWQREV